MSFNWSRHASTFTSEHPSVFTCYCSSCVNVQNLVTHAITRTICLRAPCHCAQVLLHSSSLRCLSICGHCAFSPSLPFPVLSHSGRPLFSSLDAVHFLCCARQWCPSLGASSSRPALPRTLLLPPFTLSGISSSLPPASPCASLLLHRLAWPHLQEPLPLRPPLLLHPPKPMVLLLPPASQSLIAARL